MVDLQTKKVIDGELFEKMVLGGVANLHEHLQTVNDLNVFPIPDGDTGENMYLTIAGGMDALKKVSGQPLHVKAHATAKGMLFGARGNSGVILSQLFYGLALGLDGLEIADLRQFGLALQQGVKCAYGAVKHPVEGTILTVAREASQNALDALTENTTLETFFAKFLGEMKKSLQRTPDLLAVLKEAGVIDSGGAGLVYIAEGFCKALGGEEVKNEASIGSRNEQNTLDFSLFNEDSVMEYGYCTELLVQLQNSKTEVNNFSVDELIAYLETLGDSIVAVLTGTIVKIHVHTMTPHKVLEYCQRYGEFLTVKIENMTLQHNETQVESESRVDDIVLPKRARRKFAVVTTAMGEGLSNLFKEMGADAVVEGGQTNNPSAEDFVRAFDEVNADCIFVLPNNGNIILSAKQASEIYEGSTIKIIESKTLGQGYSALSMMDLSLEDGDEIERQMADAMQTTVTGMVARSVRDASLNGVEVKKDWYMGFTDKTMLVSKENKNDVAVDLAKKLSDDREFLIVVYGRYATEEERAELLEKLAEKCPSVEVYEVDGGQDVYDYIFIVE